MSKLSPVVAAIAVAASVCVITPASAASTPPNDPSPTGHITVSDSIVIDASPNTVWNTVRDFDAASVWLPAVESSILTHGKNNTPGAIRQLSFDDGSTAQEKLTAWSASHKRFSYQILKSDLPVRNYHSTLAVEPDGNQNSRLVWEAQFDAAKNTGADGARQSVKKMYRAALLNVRRMLGVNQ